MNVERCGAHWFLAWKLSGSHDTNGLDELRVQHFQVGVDVVPIRSERLHPRRHRQHTLDFECAGLYGLCRLWLRDIIRRRQAIPDLKSVLGFGSFVRGMGLRLFHLLTVTPCETGAGRRGWPRPGADWAPEIVIVDVVGDDTADLDRRKRRRLQPVPGVVGGAARSIWGLTDGQRVCVIWIVCDAGLRVFFEHFVHNPVHEGGDLGPP
mmetsp:Transcript_53863/g.89591  ORF Transcript_53863/g.89591 Transcript_53863/m.89591 type:complete len:208 (+) Transcript_53863:1564-2187(+)